MRVPWPAARTMQQSDAGFFCMMMVNANGWQQQQAPDWRKLVRDYAINHVY